MLLRGGRPRTKDTSTSQATDAGMPDRRKLVLTVSFLPRAPPHQLGLVPTCSGVTRTHVYLSTSSFRPCQTPPLFYLPPSAYLSIYIFRPAVSPSPLPPPSLLLVPFLHRPPIGSFLPSLKLILCLVQFVPRRTSHTQTPCVVSIPSFSSLSATPSRSSPLLSSGASESSTAPFRYSIHSDRRAW